MKNIIEVFDLKNFETYSDINKPGLYALFIKDVNSLLKLFSSDWCQKIIKQLESNICKECLYIGIATKNLSERIKKDHSTGTIRNSTLRYTISYCTNLPRYSVIGSTPSKHRKMSIEDEVKITNWIKNYTEFKIFKTNDYKILEEKFIEKYCPPFNIDDNPNRIIERSERTKNFVYIDKQYFDNLK